MITPPPLAPGDTIALIAPSSYILAEETKQCVGMLEVQGFKVKLADQAFDQWGSFAGTDKRRSEAVMEAFLDDEVNAIWCLRGGYGAGRLLDQLDFETIKKHPKIFIGMSDITALHVMLNQKADLVTFLGPNAGFLLAPPPEKDRKIAEEAMWKILTQQREEPFTVLGEKTLVSGTAKASLIGGNLALIAAHIGTPFQIETKGKILLLEDVNEKTYRIDRMLLQMKQAGLLDNLAGVILCSWWGCSTEFHFEIDEVLKNYFEKASYPVLIGFPSGHIEEQITLPLGGKVHLDADAKTVTFLSASQPSYLKEKGLSFLQIMEKNYGKYRT